VIVGCVSSSTVKYLGSNLGYGYAPTYGYAHTVSPSLLAPRTALDVLPLSLSGYPGNSAYFNQFPGLAWNAPFLGLGVRTPAVILPEEPLATPDDAVDVTEAEKEGGEPIVTIAHYVDALPSPPKSPFRNELPPIPAGIVQATQPVFSHELFKNPKFASKQLFVTNSKVSQLLTEIQGASAGLPSVVRVF